MTTRYVGAGGNDSNTGLSWAQRKLTLNGVEDTPVEAGDTVYVGPGTYRELLTCDVDGTSGAGVITYVGDYDGTHTDGTGGVVRITGSDNDLTATRASCITSAKAYRTFTGFTLDTVGNNAAMNSTGANLTVSNCYIDSYTGISATGANVTGLTITNCYINLRITGVNLYHSADVDNAGIVISNCLFFIGSAGQGLNNQNIGGVVIKNCAFINGWYGIYLSALPASGQTITINNCLFHRLYEAIKGVASSNAYLLEDYNNIYDCTTARANVDVGAHSTTKPTLFDSRWFFEMVGGGSMLSPFDLASYSQILNTAGTSPTTADMRGTTVQGTQREWGALEYDSTLDIEAGSGTGGAVNISPCDGEVAL